VSLLLAALKVQDAEKVLEELDIPEGPAEPTIEAQFMEAVRDLRRVLEDITEAA
jgi:hypothetical protein